MLKIIKIFNNIIINLAFIAETKLWHILSYKWETRWIYFVIRWQGRFIKFPKKINTRIHPSNPIGHDPDSDCFLLYFKYKWNSWHYLLYFLNVSYYFFVANVKLLTAKMEENIEIKF